MNLIMLEATFLRYEKRECSLDKCQEGFLSPHDHHDFLIPVNNIGEAHGIRFLCPKNYQTNKGIIGTHSVYVYFSGSPVPANIGKNKAGETVRWNKSGTGLTDLSLTPSIQEQDDSCKWHGFVTNGDAA